MKKLLWVASLMMVMTASAFAQTANDDAAFNAEFEKILVATDMNTQMSEAMTMALSKGFGEKIAEAKKAAMEKDISERLVPVMVDEIRKVYREIFTVEDMKNLNAFYATPTGKKMAQSMQRITSSSIESGQKYGPILMEILQKHLSK